jgi:uncharacterized protein
MWFSNQGRGYFMAYFFFKLVPPRPSFPQDMTEAEGELMKRHAAYWQSLLDKGLVLVFGPVLDPKGPYGAGIATFADDETARSFAADDPVIKADCGFTYEVCPMAAVTREPQSET